VNPLDCLLIADDLTGACDAAVHFAVRGRRTVVPIAAGAGLEGADAMAINTESRCLDAPAACEAIRAAAARWSSTPASILLKKIDSTLRGHTGVEIAAALEGFACDAAIVCPAFPGMDRIVEGGCLRMAGDAAFEPVEVAAHLCATGASGCVHAAAEDVARALRAGVRMVAVDAASDDDLDGVVAAGRAAGLRILWAGSAGLASALARTLAAREQQNRQPVRKGPVLFCIGSDHRVTMVQQTALMEHRGARVVECGDTIGCAQAALAEGRHVVLRISRDTAVERMRGALAGARPAALVISGGDTAALVCRAAGVEWIDLAEEILPGIPRGTIRGGEFDGFAVATKSGGFGRSDALMQVADYFTCLNL